tara:strand:+ start:3101 stop:3649 length:549 start_codon:yes stop_codon:yes gene_type:complete
MFSLSSLSSAQMVLEISFDGNSRQIRESKRMLRKYDIYLVLPKEEIKCNYYNDGFLNIEDISTKQINKIDSNGFVVTKFINRSSCLYYLFTDELIKDSILDDFRIYRSAKTIDILGLFSFQIRNNGLVGNITYQEDGSRPTNIAFMITCSEYEGQFDNGMKEYVEWKTRRYLEWQKSQEKSR